MSNYETITTEKRGPSLVIALNRPARRNAVSKAMMSEIIDAAHQAETDESVRGVIITGGDDYFSAGADLNEAFQVKSASDGRAYFACWHLLNDTLEKLSRPVIAAVEGFCMTGGFELALACDLRIAAEDATFAITSSKIGTVAGAGGTQRLPRIVGVANALEILLSADPISAAEAHRMGAVNRVCPKGRAVAEAERMVGVYAERAPLSLAFVKRAVYRGMQMDLQSGIEFETFLVTTIYGTDDKREGISAFLEKRKATFSGR